MSQVIRCEVCGQSVPEDGDYQDFDVCEYCWKSYRDFMK